MERKHKMLVKKLINRISLRDITSDLILPMLTVDEIFSFNDHVYNDDYREQILDMLKRYWNPELRKCVKILFEKLMHYSAITEFSWTGKTSTPGKKTQKQKFSKLEGMFKLFVDFCNAGPVCHPNKVIISEIQIFLKRSNQTYRRIYK